jgi:DNA gyrase subunit A
MTENNTPQSTIVSTGQVIDRDIDNEMKNSYMDYSMSVIIGRALPDARDGFKPVHRRILHSMNETGMVHNKPHKKSARVVGDVLGKYHPHGDTAVYDSAVRMAQDFATRYPLIDGHGNFGSVDGDSAAAMRYTEMRMDKIASEMLQDIDKNTVNFVPNYDASLDEPTVLPSKFPNLMVNGSTGIAVGMATNMAPHNLSEVIDGICSYIDSPDITTNELMEKITGPDFPTGGIVLGNDGIKQAYETGRGSIKLRAKTDTEDIGNGKTRIIVSEIPYQVNKAKLIENMAGLVRDKKISGIADIRDESDKEGMRIVIETIRGTNPDVLLNQLYKHTNLQTSFGIINLAIVNNEPRILSLKDMIQIYVNHRMDVIQKRTQFDYDKASDKKHILTGINTALDNIDDIITLIKGSNSTNDARQSIMKYGLDEKQAQAILDMKLNKLTSMETQKIKDDIDELVSMISEYQKILDSDEIKRSIIKDELSEMKSSYGDHRRTIILADGRELTDEDLIPREDVVITLTNEGYIKRTGLTTYNRQKRGGIGSMSMNTKESDFVSNLLVTSSHDYVMFFTSHGKVYLKKAYEIVNGSKQSKGKPIIHFLELAENEMVSAIHGTSEFQDDHYVVMATRSGIIKKTQLSEFNNTRKSGLIAINLQQDDILTNVAITDGNCDIVMSSRSCRAVRFPETDIRISSRQTMGVIGMKLQDKDDHVVNMSTIDSDNENKSIVTITENGYGKRTSIDEFSQRSRAGKGILSIAQSLRNGHVVGCLVVDSDDEMILTSRNGNLIRLSIEDIPIRHRQTKGIRMMNLKSDDEIITVKPLGTSSIM